MPTSPDSARSAPIAPLSPTPVRFSLTAKIVVWGTVNLLLVALGFTLLIRFQLGVDSLLGGPSGDRLQALGEVVAAEFEERPRSQWGNVLARFASAYQVQIAAFRGNGDKLTGEIAEPPSEVLERLREFRGRRPGEAPPPFPPGEGPPRGEDLHGGHRRPRPPGDWAPGERPPGGRPGGPPHPPGERPGPTHPMEGAGRVAPSQPAKIRPIPPPGVRMQGPQFQKFILHTGAPPRYWVGMHLPLRTSVDGPLMPVNLVIASSSLRSGGLLMDLRPWVVVGGAILLGSALLWLPLIRGITGSLREMTRAAGFMAQGRFETEVDTARSDELGQLGASLNHMAGRLQEFVTGQKRFLGDIAHELCSPLARMELALGVLEQRADEKQHAYVEDVREEVRHMSRLLDELLSFTKAGLRAEIQLQRVNVESVVRRAMECEQAEGAEFRVALEPGAEVVAEPELFTRAVANVLRNAVRYAGGAGPIWIRGSALEGAFELSIQDSGPGVPSEALHRLFDPFFRPEAARTRETGGAGLGLAIVKSCLDACGGSVTVRNVSPTGLEVRLKLPRPDASASGPVQPQAPKSS